MSIQRWDIWGYEWEQDPYAEGDWVKYADHVAAMESAERRRIADLRSIEVWHEEWWARGKREERARIKAAVQALGPLLDVDKYKGGYDCCGCSTTYDLHEHVLAIIDGEQA